jgi:hypothetical protein
MPTVRRPQFLTLLGNMAAWLIAASAQQGDKVPRLVCLLPAARDPEGQEWSIRLVKAANIVAQQ